MGSGRPVAPRGNGPSSMDLPDLLPDFAFRGMPATEEAIGFAFEVKRAAMGPHIVRRWP